MAELPWLVLHGVAAWRGALGVSLFLGVVRSVSRARRGFGARKSSVVSGALTGAVIFGLLFAFGAEVVRAFPSAGWIRGAILLSATPFRRGEGLARVDAALAIHDGNGAIDLEAFEQRVVLARLQEDCLKATRLLLSRARYRRAVAEAQSCASATRELAVAAFELGEFAVASQGLASSDHAAATSEDLLFEIAIHLLADRDDLALRAAQKADEPDHEDLSTTLHCLSDAILARRHDEEAMRRLHAAETWDCRLLLADTLEPAQRIRLIEAISNSIPGSCKLPGFIRRSLRDIAGPLAPAQLPEQARALRVCQGHSSIRRAMAALWIEADQERDIDFTLDFDLPPLDFFLPASREDFDVYSTALEAETLKALDRATDPSTLLRHRRVNLAVKRATFESFNNDWPAALRWANLALADARLLADGDAPASLQLEKPARDAPGARSALFHAVSAERSAILFDAGRADEAKMTLQVEASLVPGAADLLAWINLQGGFIAAGSSPEPPQKMSELAPADARQVALSMAGKTREWAQALGKGAPLFAPALRLLRSRGAPAADDELLRASLAWSVNVSPPTSVERRMVEVMGRLTAARVLGDDRETEELSAILTRFRAAVQRRPAVVPLLVLARAQASSSSKFPENLAPR
ncbi:MAG: hypothetical protein ABJE95_00270 [Byssovorax sp.]